MYKVSMLFGLALLLFLNACTPDEPTKSSRSVPTPSAPSSNADLPPSEPVSPRASTLLESNIPSIWRGVAEIKIGENVFQHPVEFRLVPSQGPGYAPLRFTLETLTQSNNRNAAAEGTIRVYSYVNTVVSTGGASLEFYNIQPYKDGFQAVLTGEQGSASSSINTFVSTLTTDPRSLSGQLAERDASITGSNAVEHIFRPGTQLSVKLQENQLVGSISGAGYPQGLTFSSGDVSCTVTFVTERTQ